MKDYMDDAEELKLDDTEAMEFHYFKLHDYDGNNKLDGLELGAAMTHYHDDGEDDDGEDNAQRKAHVRTHTHTQIHSFTISHTVCVCVWLLV